MKFCIKDFLSKCDQIHVFCAVLSIGMWGLVMVLVGYGTNDIRLRVWEMVEWMICHSFCKHLHQRLLLPAIQHSKCWWVLFYLLMLWRSRERLKQSHSKQNALAHWALDTTWIGWMVVVGESVFSGGCRDGCM